MKAWLKFEILKIFLRKEIRQAVIRLNFELCVTMPIINWLFNQYYQNNALVDFKK
jgi:hypothetical protein